MILCIIDDLSSSIQLDILFLFYFLSAHSLAFFFSFFFFGLLVFSFVGFIFRSYGFGGGIGGEGGNE